MWTALLVIHQLRSDAEIQHLGIARVRNHDVGALQIPVDDMVLMRMVERAGDLNRITADLIGRERVLQETVQGLTGDILHDDEGDAIGFFDAVDRADMRVAQRRGRARLTQQVARASPREARVPEP